MNTIEIQWPIFKTFIFNRNLSIQYIDIDNNYYLYAIDGVFSLSCLIPKSDSPSTDQADFETNFKPSGNKKFEQDSNPLVNTDLFKLNAVGFSGVGTNGTTSNIDYKFSAIRYIRGLELILENHVPGDKVCLQIVDVDNLLGAGAGYVITEFADNWNIASDKQSQGLIMQPFRAKIPAGFYLRIEYHSTGSTDVNVRFNMVLDQKLT